jgi:SAM-dependent methyltransferase
MMKKLNIGAGTLPKAGYDNLDYINYNGKIEIVADLMQLPLPIQDNTYDIIEGDHILEHMPNLVPLLEDLYRIAKPGAKLSFLVPHYASGNWAIDPTHCNKFNIQTLEIFDSHDQRNKIHPWGVNSKFKFKLTSWKLTFNPWILKPMELFVKKFSGFYEYHLAHIIQPEDLHFTLEVIK